MLPLVLWSGLVLSGPTGFLPGPPFEGGFYMVPELRLAKVVPVLKATRMRRAGVGRLVIEEATRFSDRSTRTQAYAMPIGWP
jgi:hypothetical protein